MPLLAGDSFLSLSADIEAAYREYLSNYSQVTVLEDSYKQKEALWNDIIRVVKSSAWVLLFPSLTVPTWTNPRG